MTRAIPLVIACMVVIAASFVLREDTADAPSAFPADTAPIDSTVARELEEEPTASVPEPAATARPITVEAPSSIREQHWPWLDDGFGSHPRAHLTGTIVWADGTAVPSAEVTLFIDDDDGRNPELDRVDTMTDRQGSFEIPRAPALNHLGLQIRNDTGFAFHAVGMLRVGESVDLGEVVLPRSGRLQGRVFDQFGRPVPGHRLIAFNSFGSDVTMETRSGENGYYEFLVAGGIISVGGNERILVRPGEVVERDIELDVEVRGRVIYEDGEAAKSATVAFRHLNGKDYAILDCDSEGRFARTRSLPYPIELVASSGAFEVRHELTGPSLQPLVFTLERGVDVTFRMKRPRGLRSLEAEEGLLTIGEWDAESKLQRGCETTFVNLPPGVEAHFTFEAYECQPIDHIFTTPDSGHALLEFDVLAAERRSRELEVEVVSVNGGAVPGARIDPDDLGAAIVTDENGHGTVQLQWLAGEHLEIDESPTLVDLLVTAEGFVPSDRRYTIGEGAIRVLLEPESVVTVDVVDSEGVAVEALEAWIQFDKELNDSPIISCGGSEFEVEDRFAEARAPGSTSGVSHVTGPPPYRIGGLPVGTHRLSIRISEGHELRQEVEVSEGSPTHVTVELPQPFTVECIVTGTSSPFEYLECIVTRTGDPEQEFRRRLKLDSEGRAELELRSPGVYTARIRDILNNHKIERGMYVQGDGEVFEFSF